jgi:hypothetical protein
MDVKRKVSITIKIDDCKDCPHSLTFPNKTGTVLKYFCAAVDETLVEWDQGKDIERREVPVIPIPDYCPLI